MSAGGKGTAGHGGGGSRRSGGGGPPSRFPRIDRVNEVLRQVLAEEIERLVDTDERLTLLTITAVETDRDFRRATLLFSRLGPVELEALADARVRLQAAVARQVRLKWTPLLSFAEDPAIVGGQRVEDILRELRVGGGQAGDGLAGDGQAGDGLAGDGLAGDGRAGDGLAGDDGSGGGDRSAGGRRSGGADRPPGGAPAEGAVPGAPERGGAGVG